MKIIISKHHCHYRWRINMDTYLRKAPTSRCFTIYILFEVSCENVNMRVCVKFSSQTIQANKLISTEAEYFYFFASVNIWQLFQEQRVEEKRRGKKRFKPSLHLHNFHLVFCQPQKHSLCYLCFSRLRNAFFPSSSLNSKSVYSILCLWSLCFTTVVF